MTKMTLQMHPDATESVIQTTSMPVADNRGLPSAPSAPGAPPGEKPVGDTPLILGKFKSQADLEAAYKSLESQLGSRTPAPSTPPAGEAPAVPAGTPAGALTDADMERFGQEVLSQGDLTPGSYDEIVRKSGLPRSTIEAHVSLMKRDAELKQQALLATVGGKESFDKMAEWARTGGLDPVELKEFNAAVASGDEARTRVSLGYLKSKFEAGNSTPPAATYGGRGPATPTVAPFESWTQVQAAMSDPRYRDDPAYRASVAERMAHSHNIAY